MSMLTTRRQALKIIGGGATGAVTGGLLSSCGTRPRGKDTIRMRLSHHWPKTTDFRGRLTQEFAKQMAEQTDGEVAIQVHPNASLIEPTEQYTAMTQGTIELSLFPVDYATGQHPIFGVTSLPTLIKNHAQARNWQTAAVGGRLEQEFERNGTKILIWAWNTWCIGAPQARPAVTPDDIRAGKVWRGGSQTMESLLHKAGASISTMPSSETYSALQTGVLDALVTSPASFRSFRLWEVTSAYTSPTQNTLGFFFVPLLIAADVYERLPQEVQAAFDKVSSDLQGSAYEASEQDDLVTERRVEQEGDTVATIDDSAFSQWQQLARPVWDRWATKARDGEEFIDLALNVPEGGTASR